MSGPFAAVIATLWIMLCLVSAYPVHSQTAAVRGFVSDGAEGHALQGVHVLLVDHSGMLRGAVSDGDGFYIISRVPPGRYDLSTSYIGYEAFTESIQLAAGDQVILNISLHPGEPQLDEVIVVSEREGGARISAGLQRITREEVERIPSPDVSGDLASYLSAVPGVVLMGDRGGQLFVRGGEATHNLVLLDGMPIQQPFHIVGFYSAFPSDILSRVDLYAGGFGSRFSGRISSVVDAYTRSGSKSSFKPSVSISPFTASALIEGPLLPGRISFLGSFRRSMLEELASRYVRQPLPYVFGDSFGKVHALIGDNQQVSISAVRTYDRGLLTEKDLFWLHNEIRWHNTAYGLRYLVVPRVIPMLGEVVVSVSRFGSELGRQGNPTRSASTQTIDVSVHLTNFASPHEVNWGFFLREPRLAAELGGLFQNLDLDNDRSTNAGGYVEPDLYLGRGFRVRPGMVGHILGRKGFFLEPRLRVLLQRGIHEWSAAAGLYRQEIAGLVDRRDATSIFTAWVQTPLGRTSRAVHSLLGYQVSPVPWLDFAVGGFYKDLKSLFSSEWAPFPRFTTNLQEASGRARGFDARLAVRRPTLSMLINYGHSSTIYTIEEETLMQQAGTNTLSFRPPHDRRHQVNVMASTSVYGFDLNIRWNFGSGLPYSEVHGFDGFILMDGTAAVDEVKGMPRIIYSDPFGGELPTYHRFDFTVERRFEILRDLELTLQAGAINAYSRRNLFALDLFTLERADQLPFVPVVGMKINL